MKSQVYETFSRVEDCHWWFSGRRSYIRGLIDRYVASGSVGSVCEVGCGTGGNLPMLAELGPVDAVEMDDFGRRCAEARGIDRVRVILPGALPDDLPVTGPYKAVFSLDVVEHLEDDVAAVRALGALLDEDGVLVLTVPAYRWIWSHHDDISQHVRRYGRNEFVRVVEDAGLEVRFASYFNTLLAPAAIASRLAERLRPRPALTESSVGLDLPPRWLNAGLRAIFEIESRLAGRLRHPFGLSVAVVASRTHSGGDGRNPSEGEGT